MTPSYVPLTPSAIPAALTLMSAFYSEESLDYRETRARGALQQLVANPGLGAFQFIRLEGEPAGYFVLTIGFSLEFAGPFALLDEFYITPAYRGRGAGAQAFDQILRVAASFGVASIRLEVDRANPRVQGFYRRHGFEPHDRDIMTKWLK